MYEKIVVTLDGSELAETALPYAEGLAERMDAELILLSVFDANDQDNRQKNQAYIDGVIPEILKRAARRTAALPDKQIKLGTATRSGDAAEGIVRYANRGKTSKLVVMATHGRSGLSRWALGSVADKVVRTSLRQPLLLIRADGQPPHSNGNGIMKEALVPLDGSLTSETVLPYIHEIAFRFKMKVTLLQVVSPDEPDNGDAEEYLDNTCRWLQEEGVAAKYLIREGLAADEVINLAEETDVDMVAMSTHGRSGLSRWALGSVADKVLLGGSKPLMLVRA